MGKRTYESDIIAMALLYRKEYIGSDMISLDKAKEFDKTINDNLDSINSKSGIGIRYSCYDDSNLFTIMTGENNKLYAVINPNANLKDAWSFHIGLLPTDVIIAAQMDNALSIIGLKKIIDKDNNKIYITKKEQVPRLIKKKK